MAVGDLSELDGELLILSECREQLKQGFHIDSDESSSEDEGSHARGPASGGPDEGGLTEETTSPVEDFAHPNTEMHSYMDPDD
ncbi:MAG: hypothetical protein M1812_008497 [Candelaria pacifica]|nr:MAG: hypothetical protein M1812_008497 [Candelaria pacifica]